jgi:hypothetical protein
MSLLFNYSLLFILAAAFGVLAAFGLVETPTIFGGMLQSKGNFDVALLFLGSASAFLGVCEFLFMRSRPRNAWLSFSVLGAILIYAEVFNVKPIKFTACEVLLHGRRYGPVYYSNGVPSTLEERSKGLVD